MYFYIGIVLLLLLLCMKKNYLLKNYGVNLEFNEPPFTTMDLHTLNQNFGWTTDKCHHKCHEKCD